MTLRHLTFTIIIFSFISAIAETLPSLARPLDIPLILSGNFGELRSNHFHSGLDFKTQGKTGYAIRCSDDGYVSRVLVSPWGYGRAIYVTHPTTGLTTVYGHLESFATKIDRPVRAEQYRQESFRVDLTFAPGQIPVKKGEIIGRSGNSGSSGGPHLHYEVRDTKSEYVLDPMPYFKQYITDKVAPEVRSLALYPRHGLVDGTSKGAYRSSKTLAQPFTAWGEVVAGIKAYDRMSGTTNIYGIRQLTLTVDGKEVYRRTVDHVDFHRTRAINTIIDYPDLINSKSWIMTTYVPQSMPLSDIITASSDGIITIDEERDYQCEWTMIDAHGNRSSASFVIQGRRSDIPTLKRKGDLFKWNGVNTITHELYSAKFPAETFYDDIYFTSSAIASSAYCSPIVTLGSPDVALSGNYSLSISITADTVVDKAKYCLVRINGSKKSAVDATYSEGRISASVNRLGSYAVTTDTKAPIVKPLRPERWKRNGAIVYKISDNLSGIKDYRCTIDGKWVLIEYDGKTGRLSYRPEAGRVAKGKKHTVKLIVTDACGNATSSTDTFYW